VTDQCEIWIRDEESHADVGHVTKTAIFKNSRWWTAASFISLSQPWIRLSDFDQIWYADANFHSDFRGWIYDKKIEVLQIQDGGRTPYWKCFFGYISAPYWPINAKFGDEESHAYRSRNQNGNFRKFKIAYCRHFERSFVSISQPSIIIRFWSNLVRGCEFPFWGWISDKKIEILQIQNGGQTLYLHISSVNYPISIKFGMQIRIFIDKKIEILQIQDGGRTPYRKVVLWLYLGDILADMCASWTADVESHANRGHVTKASIFDNSTWRQPPC